MSSQNSQYTRPPVVAIMGHVDHGKSTLLDTIRNTNTVNSEHGGITQHVSAYEVNHIDSFGVQKRITFIDTPGHAAFQSIRYRSANIADIAILIVAADDGVKPQTIQALETIRQANVPFLVAINKIDKANADIDKCIRELLEAGVYLEGYGGDISFIKISAKNNLNIEELLETILLLSEFIDLSYKPDVKASGFVVESHIDSKKGIAATLLLKDGFIEKSNFVTTGNAIASCRAIYDFNGVPVDYAQASSPITLYGFSDQCHVGEMFTVYETKPEAESGALSFKRPERYMDNTPDSEEITIIPTVIKCDVVGSIDAVINEVKKQDTDRIFYKIVHTGVGNISESDINMVIKDTNAIIIGFNVTTDSRTTILENTKNITIKEFNIIYRIGEWLENFTEDNKFKKQIERVTGAGQILKVFSQEKNQILVGVRVSNGELHTKDIFRVIRNKEIIGKGKIISIQSGKVTTNKVEAGTDCGVMIELKESPHQFDFIECIKIEQEK